MSETKKTSLFKRIIRFPITIIAFLLALLFNIYAGWNVLKFAVYSEYYSINTTLNKNPGLNDNYISRDVII